MQETEIRSAAAAEVERDQHIARGPHGRDTIRARRRALIELEVQVRRAEQVRTLPGQIQKVLTLRRLLLVDIETREVVLVRRDRASHDRRRRIVFLGALPEGVVGRALDLVETAAQARRAIDRLDRPDVPRRDARRVPVVKRCAGQVAVARVERAAGERRAGTGNEQHGEEHDRQERDAAQPPAATMPATRSKSCHFRPTSPPVENQRVQQRRRAAASHPRAATAVTTLLE